MRKPKQATTPNWGTLAHLLAEKQNADRSWWMSAPRDGFTKRSEQEIPRMRRGRAALAIEGLSRPWD